ncbi:hypothetical protein M5K25_010657 [Dendrobium thyrsiflorum]|uniref:Uncharacterized protein n=1 Tax=Dendrobium thyrsiflorum TaxID=117978 RepID=A0ABD0V1S3_DENTH
MAAKKVDVLKECLKGKIGQLKSVFEDKMTSMEETFSNLEGKQKSPREKSTSPAATATADPLEDPPGTRSGAHGLMGVP